MSDLPRGWTATTVDKIKADVEYACTGGPFGSELTARDYVSDGVPVIRGSNLSGAESRWSEDGFVYVSAEKASSLKSCLAAPGDFIFTQRGTVGQVGRVPLDSRHRRLLISQSQMKLTVSDAEIEARYLEWYFLSPPFQHYLARETLQTGVPHINLGILRRAPVLLPPGREEQRRIADVLDRADTIRRKRREALALTDELLRATFLEMFGDPVTNPRGWPVVELGACADLASGVTKGKDYRDAKLVERPYLRVANVQAGALALAEMKTIAVSVDEAARYALAAGDVLMTEGGDPDKLGRGTVWRDEIPGCIHQNHIFRARVDRGRLDPDFLSAQLGSSRGQRYFARAAKQTTGIASINMTQLRAFPALVPPLERQVAFARTAALVRESHNLRKSAAEQSDALFASLQHRAFRGEL